jgi:hypothetical protein
MRTTSKLIIFIFTFLTLAASAYAQSPREELQKMVEQLQKTPNDNALREKIIQLAPTLKPSPVLPDTAITFEGRGQFAFRSATSEGDFLVAAQEYEKAVAAAPWVPGYYADLCTFYEKAGKFEAAKRHCGFYLKSLIDPAQMTDVKRRIAGLEFGIEKANSPQARAEREREEFAAFLRQNEGAVFKRFWARSGDKNIWDEAIIENGVLLMGTHDQSETTLYYNPHLRGKKPEYTRRTVTEFTTSITYNDEKQRPCVMTFTFSRDGKTFTKEYDTDYYVKGPNDDPNNNTYSKLGGREHKKEIFQRQ